MSHDTRQQRRERECAAMGHVWGKLFVIHAVTHEDEGIRSISGTQPCERCGKVAQWSVESYWQPDLSTRLGVVIGDDVFPLSADQAGHYVGHVEGVSRDGEPARVVLPYIVGDAK